MRMMGYLRCSQTVHAKEVTYCTLMHLASGRYRCNNMTKSVGYTTTSEGTSEGRHVRSTRKRRLGLSFAVCGVSILQEARVSPLGGKTMAHHGTNNTEVAQSARYMIPQNTQRGDSRQPGPYSEMPSCSSRRQRRESRCDKLSPCLKAQDTWQKDGQVFLLLRTSGIPNDLIPISLRPVAQHRIDWPPSKKKEL
ncbi:hypothetical protein Tco_1226381 [Tanacetum coccineum]